ncbi:MAG: signal peptidase I [Eubacteriales bacterium]|nr:signal peptidase I [Eubacteriales bacterium]
MKRSRKYDDRKLEWLRAGKEFAVFILAAVIIFRFVIGVSLVSGNSMFPTLENGQPVVYNRLSRDYHRGDIISVRMPSGEYLIKRIIAVSGDSVDIHDGKVFINGEEENSGYINGITSPQDGKISYPFTLEEGRIFVMGDNRENSVDSRSIGPLSETQIRGKIIIPAT